MDFRESIAIIRTTVTPVARTQQNIPFTEPTVFIAHCNREASHREERRSFKTVIFVLSNLGHNLRK